MHAVRPKEKHVIEAIQLSGFETESIIASAYGTGNKKKLILHTYVTSSNRLITKIKVINHDTLVYEGESLEDGIEVYNKF